ncbi:Phospho-N-acetylmuramoyl-pentapeptide-transferase [Limihaloglobus sulfuriphilus]|uniref:Phospho-N-acetylmuramoyl-pentapeptide-transferase n=1 Tax=Limihaloglobus sulfuriphilus TaxID=1851148 RepID=A0A1Q2MFA3_9BACT|nr:phospho-N-acetylmuramoyl-pentapeptide-transferase [Limihaloglobus sulfuriphilus]AQQ71350.1 Phospho-N-acetylmuramoyl-pentapeptide-transferase [Limihaloglobus sulfuriphilus]
MIYHLLEWQKGFWNAIGFYAFEDIAFRSVMAALTSLVLSITLGPKVIRLLIRAKLGDVPDSNLKDFTNDKTDVPTMGGVLILISIITAVLLWAKLNNAFVIKSIFVLVWYGLIGAADDWVKLKYAAKKGERQGLYSWEKLLFQVGGALLITLFVYFDFRDIPDGRMFWIPFYKTGIIMPAIFFIPFGVLYITALSNAVNLTDGMDGLASGCTAIVSVVLALLCFVCSETMGRFTDVTWASYLLLPYIPQSGELTVLYSGIIGSLLGFLWFNCNPAKVFMGDTGSLPLGAVIGYGAMVTRNEILLILTGGVFVWEMASVIIQVSYFKWTKKKYGQGRRVFLVAPIHHHFHKKGWPEQQVVVRFWLIALAFAAISLATLKIR